jgi:uncharacterized RDD family membrane protein YckC
MVSCTNHPEVTSGILRCTRCSRPFCPSCVIRLRGFVYCASCKGERVRDIQSGSAPGELELATIGRRFGALWVDSLFFFVLSMVGTLMVIPFLMGSTRSETTDALTANVFVIGFTVLVAALMMVYEGLMLSSRGQTLGKMALGIKVVTPEGRDISTGQAWGRSLLRQVFFSYLSLINYLPAAFTKQRTCLHDLIAKTRVIRVRS